jgi:hypothetical protein
LSQRLRTTTTRRSFDNEKAEDFAIWLKRTMRGRCRCEGSQSRNDHSEDVKKPTGESLLKLV